MDSNIQVCARMIRQAASEGCKLVATPENTGRMTAVTQKAATNNTAPSSSSHSSPSPSSSVPPANSHPVLLALLSLAHELNIHILIGSLAVRVEGETRFANRCYLIGPNNKILAEYDKIFMFDVPALNGAESYLESARILPGSQSVLVNVPDLAEGAAIGLTICYDLRFPQLYRALAQAGANIITVPSAFTVVTGEAHWHSLLRARAIETGCWILAPAQSGTHPGNRQTFGHSLIVSPWGEIVADAGTEAPAFITTEIDLDKCEEVRKRIPSLTHDRPFTIAKF